MATTMNTSKIVTARVSSKTSHAAGLPAMAAKPMHKKSFRASFSVRAEAESTPEATAEIETPVVKYEPLDVRLQPLFEKSEEIEYQIGGQRWQELMAFEGFAPEVINGRLAMLGFVAAAGAELTTGQSFMTQFGNNFIPVAFHLGLFAAASFLPAIMTEKSLPDLVKSATGREAAGFGGNGFPEALEKFTPEVELLNGRAAMVGVASMIVLETVKGSAIF